MAITVTFGNVFYPIELHERGTQYRLPVTDPRMVDLTEQILAKISLVATHIGMMTENEDIRPEELEDGR